MEAIAKSVYSLVLSDEVVELIDRQAASQGFSRSAYVEHLLASQVNLQTPQATARQMLELVRLATGQRGLRTVSASQTGLTLRTALNYKYNPAMQYVLETRGGRIQLRVWLRSQNRELGAVFLQFVELWMKMEIEGLPQPPAPPLSRQAENRFWRELRLAPGQDAHQYAQAVTGYIGLMDDCMQTFFGSLDDRNTACDAAQALYNTALAQNAFLLEL